MNATQSCIPDAAPGQGREVLLVDDDPLQLKLVRIQLECAGFVVRTALGAAAAHDALARSGPPAAIVSDIVMDQVDGFTLCNQLRRDPKLASVPIVLLSSAFDEDEDRALALSVGANALVDRSVDQRACVAALMKCLEDAMRQTPLQPLSMPDLYAERLTHQLARVSGKRAAAEARYETLFEYATDAICLLTQDGHVINANRRWEQLRGLPREELRGRHITDFAAPGHEEGNNELYRQQTGAATGCSPAVAIAAADGSTIFLEFTTTAIELDGVMTVLSIGRDVTQLREAQRELEAKERLYRTLVENVPDVMWSSTHDWRYTYFSPNVVRLCGYTADEILSGKHSDTFDCVHVNDVERLRVAREATATHGAPLDIEYRWQRLDGRWLWIHLRAVRGPSGIDGIFSDITARKQLEDQLFHAQKVEAIGQLTAGVAHDFNNLLSIISMSATLLVESMAGNDDVALARDIEDAARHGAELTQQLLAFSRRQQRAPEALDVDQVVTQMKRMLTQLIGPEITLATSRGEQLGVVRADSGQLERVVLNLVINARDAMEGHGTLSIDTSNVEVDDAVLGSSGPIPAGSYVRLSVRDSGCGMDEGTLARIFEPFFTTKPDGSGTGLGLSTCYGIVRHAGGHFAVESERGVGTTFRVYLPRLPGAATE